MEETKYREIIFRGLDCFGNWQQGSLITDNKTYWFIDNSICNVKVFPESIGQFTGLIDKKGIKVFEGDYIKFKTTRYHSKNITTKSRVHAKWFKSPILFYHGEFMINESTKMTMDADDYDTPLICCFNIQKDGDFESEVVGTIHDTLQQQLIDANNGRTGE